MELDNPYLIHVNILYNRSKTTMGSTIDYPPTMTFGGILSSTS